MERTGQSRWRDFDRNRLSLSSRRQGRASQAEALESAFKYSLPDMNAALGLSRSIVREVVGAGQTVPRRVARHGGGGASGLIRIR